MGSHSIRRLIAALILVLAMPTAAMAADQTVTSAETLTVLATTSLTGIPATLAYGSAVTGYVDAPAFTFLGSSNNAHGLNVQIASASGGFSSVGGGTMPRAARWFIGAAPSASCSLTGGAPSWATPGKAFGSSGALTICATTGPVADLSATITPRVLIPAGQAAGAYTASLVILAFEIP